MDYKKLLFGTSVAMLMVTGCTPPMNDVAFDKMKYANIDKFNPRLGGIESNVHYEVVGEVVGSATVLLNEVEHTYYVDGGYKKGSYNEVNVVSTTNTAYAAQNQQYVITPVNMAKSAARYSAIESQEGIHALIAPRYSMTVTKKEISNGISTNKMIDKVEVTVKAVGIRYVNKQ